MLTNTLAALVGSYIGLLVWTSTVRWIYSIWNVVTERSDTGQSKAVPVASVLVAFRVAVVMRRLKQSKVQSGQL